MWLGGVRRCRWGLLVAIAFAFAFAGPAQAASGPWERAWGKDVDSANPGVFGICVVASSCLAGSAGGLGGELGTSPEGVATDTAGNVYVADTGNNRIQKYDSAGNFLLAWGKDVDSANPGVFGVCNTAASCLPGTTGGLGGELLTPYGVATDTAGNVYVADSNNVRIQKYDSSGNWQLAWGKNVDSANPGVAGICDVAGSCLRGTDGALGGELNNPGAVATDTAGNVYVSEYGNNRIQKFDSSGNFQRTWGKDVDTGGDDGFEICTTPMTCKIGLVTPADGGVLDGPEGIATDAAGNVYVGEYFDKRIQKFDSSGNFLRTWGKNVINGGGTGAEICTAELGALHCQGGLPGALGGELNFTRGVATDTAGNVYVADGNNRIQKFDSSGNFLRAWGKNVNGGGVFGVCTVAANCLAGSVGALGGEFFGPNGVAADAAGALYAADVGNNRIQKFADPVVPSPPGTTTAQGSSTGLTGQRAAALKKCKKKRRAARKKCKKKAKLLPV